MQDVGCIVDLSAGEHTAALHNHLAHGLHTVEDCRPVPARDRQPVRRDLDIIFLRSIQLGLHRQEDVPCALCALEERARNPCMFLNTALQYPSINGSVQRHIFVNRKNRVPANLIKSLFFLMFFWLRKQIHFLYPFCLQNQFQKAAAKKIIAIALHFCGSLSVCNGSVF